MISMEKGNLTMNNQAWEDVIFEINSGCSPKQGLINIVEFHGYSAEDIESITLTGSQVNNDEYREVYSQIVCEYWNDRG